MIRCYPKQRFILRDHAFFDHVHRNLDRRPPVRLPLLFAAYKLAFLNRKLRVLHVTVMLLKQQLGTIQIGVGVSNLSLRLPVAAVF